MWNLLLLPLLNKTRVSKLVVISGCSRGLGRAMALEFSSRGWKVAGGARTVDSLDELSLKMISESLFVTLDVTDPESVESFAQQVEGKFGSPDLLVNNAGLINPYCATKWGVEGLTRSLAQELPSGLAAVAFNPGVINTDMLQSTFGEQAHTYPSPAEWAIEAVNRLEKLSPVDNGKTSNP
jgi:NAD(P)-dependent dehydrogenase (short-subunit alcohol dehydrogenase family)